MRRRNTGGLKLSLVFCALVLLLSLALTAFLPRLTRPVSAISTTLGYGLNSDYVAIISGPDGKPIDTTQPILAYPSASSVYIEVDKNSNQIVFAESDGGSGPGYMYDPSISPLTINIYRATDAVNCNERRCQNEIKSTNPLTALGNESIRPLASYTFPDDVVKVVSSRDGSSFNFSVTDSTGQTTEATVEEDPDAGDSSSDDYSTSCSSAASGLGWILCPIANFLNGVLSSFYSWMEQYLQINPMLFADPEGSAKGLRSAWAIFRNLANVFFVIYILVMIVSQITGFGISNYGIKKNLPRVIVSAILLNLSFYLCVAVVDITNVVGASLKNLFSALASTIELKQTGIIGGITGIPRTLAGLGVLTAAGVPYLLSSGGVASALIGVLMALISVLATATIAVIGMFFALAIRQGLIVICVAVAPIAIIFYTLPNTKNVFNRWWKLFRTLIFMYPICAFVIGAGTFASTIILSTGDDIWTVLISVIAQVGPYFFLPTLVRNSINAAGNLGRIVGRTTDGADRFAQKNLPYVPGLRRLTAIRNANVQGVQKRREAYQRNRMAPILNRVEAENQLNSINSQVEDAAAIIARYGGTPVDQLNYAQQALLAQAKETVKKYGIIDPQTGKRGTYYRNLERRLSDSNQATEEEKETEQALADALVDVRNNTAYVQGKNAAKMFEDLVALVNNPNATDLDLIKARAIALTMASTKGSEGVLINGIYGLDEHGGNTLRAKLTDVGLKKFNEFYNKDQKLQSIIATEDGNLNLLLSDLAKMEANGQKQIRTKDGQVMSYATLTGTAARAGADFSTIGAAYTKFALKDAQKITAASGDTLKRYKDYIEAADIVAATNPTNTALASSKADILRKGAKYQAWQATEQTRQVAEQTARQAVERAAREASEIERDDTHFSEAIRQAGKNDNNYYDPPANYLPVLTGPADLNRPGGSSVIRVSDGKGDEKLFDQSSGRVTSRRKVIFKDSAGVAHEFVGYDMAPRSNRLHNGTDTGLMTADEPVFNPATNLVDFQYKNDTTGNIETGHYDPVTGAYSY